MVKNPPCNAGDTGLIPVRGTKIPHATGQLSLCTTESPEKDPVQQKKKTKKKKPDPESHLQRLFSFE